ncbi:MAG: hypothetical protein E2O39_16315 [Planctomycetota bacterium]|nr:MAG: hypothetical protein E2O39_16315 [Planctomycetota bacterium]
MDTRTTTDLELVEEILHRVTSDLSMITDRAITTTAIEARRRHQRPAGAGVIHISFKLAVGTTTRSAQGCLLVPLPEAIAIASYLMMVPEELVAAKRAEVTLDSSMKDALQEVGTFIATAANTAVQALGLEQVSIRSEGCQGVRPDVRPALEYVEGDELLVGEATAELDTYPAFKMLLILPAGILE